jgi:biotin carboxyl carrier protein
MASRYSETPNSVEQWATSTALRCLASNVEVQETSLDENSQPLHMIAVPMDDQNQQILVALFVDGSVDSAAELAAMRSAVANLQQLGEEVALPTAEEIAQDIAAIQELNSKIANTKSVKSGCQTLSNSLADFLETFSPGDQSSIKVFVASVDKTGQPTLAAVSKADSIPDDNQLIECIESAMAECLCRNSESVWPPSDQDRTALLCHRRLSEQTLNANLITFLLPNTDRQVQSVVQVASQRPLSTRAHRFLKSCAEPFGATLSLVQRGENNRLQRWLISIRESFATDRTKMIAKCVATVFVLGLIPTPYRISGDAEVQPASKRFVCAPFDSKLKNCLVEPGDYLEAGQVIAQLDEREINLELAETAADYHRVSKKRDGFVASHESGEARLAQYETEMLGAKNDLLTHRAENLELKSPIAGVVIAGDLKDAVGMPLEQGQSLFEIAPLTSFSVDVFIPQADIRYAKAGMSVKIRLEAYPFETWNGVIENVHPGSEIHNDQNVFVASVKIDDAAEKFRPGMQGSAKISSIWRPFLWNVLEKPAANCLRYVGW